MNMNILRNQYEHVGNGSLHYFQSPGNRGNMNFINFCTFFQKEARWKFHAELFDFRPEISHIRLIQGQKTKTVQSADFTGCNSICIFLTKFETESIRKFALVFPLHHLIWVY